MMSLSHPESITVRRIVLTGFMGSGKTTVGRLLASRLGWAFADLDEAVAEQAGLSVPQIFATHGEAHFRAAEVASLRSLLQRKELVIALGGGAPGTPGIRDLLRDAEETAVIYLQAPFAVLFDRCCTQAQDPDAVARPLLGDREAAEARLAQREALYAAVAHHTVAADGSSPDAVVDAVLALMPRLAPAV